ncbi:NAD(P)-dependent oxidoreductase [Gammaproteobacteria bacterium]|nr:NAD(P)-dependent oxidoreductase [Gammaproteobacteria bacterium]
MRIVLTGSSGFIGSALSKELDLRTNIYEVVFASRQRDLEGNFTSLYEDLPDGDVLIHLGEINNPAKCEEIGSRCIDDAQYNFDSISRKRYKYIIYVSSGLVYGDAGRQPKIESNDVLSNTVYRKMKKLGEYRTLQSNGLVLRLSNVFGPGMGSNTIFGDVFKQLDSEGSIRIRDIGPVRDFIYIEDVVSFILLALDEKPTGIFNVSTGIGIDIGTLVQLILNICGKPLRVVESDSINKASHLVLDSCKAQNLGWQPKNDMGSAIKKLLDIEG